MSSHPEKAFLLSSKKMWSLFFAFLPVLFYFFLYFLVGVLSAVAPKTTSQVDDMLLD
jgi:hypothetical protein